MSSSFLKPWVTPCTALASNARARPCSARCSSLSRIAFSTPSFCSSLICAGTSTLSLPLGPCTSTLPPATGLIFTPEGTGIGLRPIRDIVSLSFSQNFRLPDFAKNFAAEIRLAGSATGHHALWRGENADAQPANDGTDFARAEIVALAGARNALHAGDDAAAVRRVLQEDAQGLAGLVLVHHFVGGDIALFLENAGDFGLQLRNRHVHALVLGRGRVAEAGQKVGNGIGLHNVPISLLPARFHDAGDLSLERHAAETDAAHFKLPDIAAGAAANAATVAHAHLELGLLEGLGDFRGACHLLCGSFFAQREAQALQELAAFLIVAGGCGQGDVHALDLVHAGVINFREHQLVLEAQGVIATAIKGVARQSAEVADTGKHDVAQAVEKFVHLLAAQGYGAANGHTLANLEIRDGLFRAGDNRPLPGNLPEFHGGSVQQLGVLAGFAQTDVHGDLLQLRYGHGVPPAKALHQRGRRFFPVLVMHSTQHLVAIPSKIGRPQKAAATKSLLVQRGAAALANTRAGTIRQGVMPYAGVLAAAAANHLHVGSVNRAFFFHDSALDILRRIRPGMPLDDVGVLDDHCVFARIDREHAAALARVAPGENADVVSLTHADGEALCPFVYACHDLPDLRCQRNNLGELFVAQLAGHRPEDARAHGLAGIIDEHRGIVIKTNVGAVLAALLLAHTDDHALHDLAFLDLAFRRRFLYRSGDNVSEACFQPGIAAHGQDAHELASSGIVGDSQPGSHLNHGSAPLSLLLGRRSSRFGRGGLRQHFFQAPALQARERAGRHDADGVALLGFALFVVRVEFLGDADDAAVFRVLHEPLHFDHNRFFHFGAGYLADKLRALAALGHWRRLRFRSHYALPAFAGAVLPVNSCARRSVFTRAKSFLASRRRLSASAWPVVN